MSNEVTDRINNESDKKCSILETVNTDQSSNDVSSSNIVSSPNNEQSNDNYPITNNDITDIAKEKNNYEVVFFVKYNYNPRPSLENMTNFFNNYGVVNHIDCPEGRNYAFVFMTSLSTTVEHRRTRTTINQIIKDMNPETKFHISVASSRKTNYHGYQQYPDQNNGYYLNQNNRYYPSQNNRYYPNQNNRYYSNQNQRYFNQNNQQYPNQYNQRYPNLVQQQNKPSYNNNHRTSYVQENNNNQQLNRHIRYNNFDNRNNYQNPNNLEYDRPSHPNHLNLLNYHTNRAVNQNLQDLYVRNSNQNQGIRYPNNN